MDKKNHTQCCKCSDPPQHSITIREGVIPNRYEDSKIRDTSRTRVVGFCGVHWVVFKEFLELEKNNAS